MEHRRQKPEFMGIDWSYVCYDDSLWNPLCKSPFVDLTLTSTIIVGHKVRFSCLHDQIKLFLIKRVDFIV